MSGPTGAIIVADPLAVLVGTILTRAAETMREAYAQAERERAAHREASAETRARLAAAAAQGEAEARAEATRVGDEVRQLLALATRLGVPKSFAAKLPAAVPGDASAMGVYLTAMETLRQALRSALLTEAARRQEAFEQIGMDLAGLLPTLPDAAQASQRWLARIAHLGAPPPELAELARELDACLPGERATLLATELRLRVQRHAEAVQALAVREATGRLLRSTLQDLGYQVEEVPETLFVTGGVMHFRRPGWGNYLVRLRAESKAGQVNFNVLRAIDSTQEEASELDHLAEDRWCAEFPALLKALEAQGLKLQVTRRLEAGEVPVQQVRREHLPRFEDEDRGRGDDAPRRRTLN